MIKILIYDKYQEEYYEVIPVKKIEEKIEKIKKIIDEIEKEIQEELNSEDICKEYIRDKRREMGLANRDITILQQLIKENCECEE